MAGIKDYSSTAASNTALFPENMDPADVNDGMRQVQADIRSWYEDAEWTNLGHTPTQTSSTTFTVSGDRTAYYLVNRRIKCTDSSTLYGRITASSYSAPNTTVTVSLDSGNLSASLSAVFVGILRPTNLSMPRTIYDESNPITDTSGNELLKFTKVSSAVNEVTISNAATGNAPKFSVTGGDTNIDAQHQVKGSGKFTFLDGNSNEALEIAAGVASAVNYPKIINSATGNKVKYTAAGDDANIGISIEPIGSGGVNVEGALIELKGTSSSAARLRLYEDTDNGTNYIEHIGAASISSNRTVTWPDTDISGFVVQRVSTTTAAVATGTTTMPHDDTIPQNTEGTQFLSLSITPKSTSNILVIDVWVAICTVSTDDTILGALFQDSTANALAAANVANTTGAGGRGQSYFMRHVMSAGTTSSTTFSWRAGSNGAGTVTFNGSGGNRVYGGVASSGMMITEYSA